MEREALQDRYNDEFFEKAELRRKKLGYSRISVGKVTDERVKHLIHLLYQTHQCYYFGLFKAAINLGGSLLEQAITVLFEDLLLEKNPLSLKTNSGYELVTENDGFANFGLNTLIHNALDFDIIDDKRFPKVMQLKTIRNQSVHDMLPQFELIDTKYVANFGYKNTIEISKNEVADKILSTKAEEIFAYYVLTRTRSLISHIFQDRVKSLPPTDKV